MDVWVGERGNLAPRLLRSQVQVLFSLEDFHFVVDGNCGWWSLYLSVVSER